MNLDGTAVAAKTPPAAQSEEFARLFPAVAAIVLIGLFFIDLFGALAGRSLYADAIHYFVCMLRDNGFAFYEPSRRTVHFLQEWPTVLALRLGVTAPGRLALINGLTLQLLPLALTAACYPLLPRGEKPLFIFPLAHYLLGTMPSAFVPHVGGPVAAGYFWVLLTLILFGRRRGAIAVAAALALPALLLHETTVILMPILSWAALRQARAQTSAPRRKILLALAVWFGVITLVQAWFIVFPTAPEQRLDVLLSAFLLFGAVNVPGVIAIAAVAALILICRNNSQGHRDWQAVAIFAAFCLAVEALTIALGPGSVLFRTSLQFLARNLAVLVSAPLAIGLILCRSRPTSRQRWMRRPVAALLLLVAAAQIGYQAIGLFFWDRFVAAFETVLASHSGFVPWQQALEDVTPDQARDMQGLIWGWTNPLLSIVLAPDGRVSTIIGAEQDANWQPFDPQRPDQLPAARFFDYSRYLEALKASGR